MKEWHKWETNPERNFQIKKVRIRAVIIFNTKQLIFKNYYRVSSNKHRVSNRCRPLSAAPLNVALIGLVSIFY